MFAAPMVILCTRTIEAGTAFYRDVIGFEETFRLPATGVPTHVEFSVDGISLGLGTVEGAAMAHGVEATSGTPSRVLVPWTDDVEGAYEMLVATGASSVQPPHDSGNSNRYALLRDPDGDLLATVAKRVQDVAPEGRCRPPSSAWASRDQQQCLVFSRSLISDRHHCEGSTSGAPGCGQMLHSMSV
jgi:lactoylglutathione lyase